MVYGKCTIQGDSRLFQEQISKVNIITIQGLVNVPDLLGMLGTQNELVRFARRQVLTKLHDLGKGFIWKLLLEVTAVNTRVCNPLNTLAEQVCKLAGGSNKNNRHYILNHNQSSVDKVRQATLEERDELGDLEAGGGVGGLDDEVYGRAARLVRALVVDADGGALRRRLEEAGVEVAKNGHDGVAADVAPTWDKLGELQPRLLAGGGGGERGEVSEEEVAPGGEDAPVDADDGVVAPSREDDVGVRAVEEGGVEEALEVGAEAAEADGVEVGRRSLRPRR